MQHLGNHLRAPLARSVKLLFEWLAFAFSEEPLLGLCLVRPPAADTPLDGFRGGLEVERSLGFITVR